MHSAKNIIANCEITQQDLSTPPVFHLLVRDSGTRSPSCCPAGKEGACAKGSSTPLVPSSPSSVQMAAAVPSPLSLPSNSPSAGGVSPDAGIPRSSESRPSASPWISAVGAPPPAFLDYRTGMPVSPATVQAWPLMASSPQYYPVQPPVAWGFNGSPAGSMPLGAAAAAACYEQLHRVYYEAYYQAYMAAM